VARRLSHPYEKGETLRSDTLARTSHTLLLDA
jgi:hypothetical protein